MCQGRACAKKVSASLAGSVLPLITIPFRSSDASTPPRTSLACRAGRFAAKTPSLSKCVSRQAVNTRKSVHTVAAGHLNEPPFTQQKAIGAFTERQLPLLGPDESTTAISSGKHTDLHNPLKAIKLYKDRSMSLAQRCLK